MIKNDGGASGGSSRRLTFVTLLQSTYLSCLFFYTNDLLSYAAACAFGFFFSFIPIVLMILVILVRFMRAKPQIVTDLLNVNSLLTNFINLENMAVSIQQIKKITNFEIIITLAIIWMARRFFRALIMSQRRIFKQNYHNRANRNQLFIFVGEVLITILLSSIVFIIATFRTIVQLPLLENLALRFPTMFHLFTSAITSSFPFILIFFAVTVTYRFASRTHPSLPASMLASLLCTVSFWVFQKIMRQFINVNRYNLVYGVLSNAIVMLVIAYAFFVIFLFFAQFLFVTQFLKTLLLCELYLLPDRNDTSLRSTMKRILFIRPDSLLNDGSHVINLKKGDYIYRQGDSGADAYYIVQGTVLVSRTNSLLFLGRGKFFGEESIMLEETRNENAQANTDVKIVRITEATFFSLLERNPKVARRVLSRISRYFSKFYGRNDEYPL